jgi:sulfide dehydrogenase cytochrome subunit
MPMQEVLRRAALIAALLAGFAAMAAAEMPAAVQRCVGCHGESGIGTDPNIPTLAGVGRFYLENQFAVFAANARPCVVPALEYDIDKCAVIGALDDDQKRQLAVYYDERAYLPRQQPYDDALAERGERLHAERCERCHTDNGWEPLDDAGLLAGQPIPYLVRQLEYFADDRRWLPDSMAPQIEDLTSEERRALAHFYARAGLER